MTTTTHETHQTASDKKTAADTKPADPKDPKAPTEPPTPKTIADAAAELITDSAIVNAATESALRVIGAMSAADQAKMFSAMDDEDAREGLRERRSSLIKGRLGLLQEKDAKEAADKAAKDAANPTPPTTPPADDKTPPAHPADDKTTHEKKGLFR